MSDIIEKNDSPEPSEASKVAAFGGGTTEAAAVEVPSYMPRRTLGQLLRGDLGFIPVVVTLLVVVIYFSITSGGLFLTPQNLTNLVGQIVTFGILGLGVIMVLLLGEIDLSIAAVSVYSAVVMAVLADPARPYKLPALIAIVAGPAGWCSSRSYQWYLCCCAACSLIYRDTGCVYLLFWAAAHFAQWTKHAYHLQ